MIISVKANTITVSLEDGVKVTVATLNDAFKMIKSHTTEVQICLKMQTNDTFRLLANDTVTTFRNIKKFELIGDQEMTSTIDCQGMAGLSFIRSSNILLKNVSFLNCGSLQNSSSSDLHKTNDRSTRYVTLLMGIHFLLSSNISLDHVTVHRSPGIGVVFYSTGGTNLIMNSNFMENGLFLNQSHLGGGGVAIEFVHCIPGDYNCSLADGSKIDSYYKQGTVFDIRESKFTNNLGSESLNGTHAFITPRYNHNFAIGRGGGLAIILKGNSNEISVIVSNCEFIDNKAVWGGGIEIEFQDRARNNNVVVESTWFINNQCHYTACNYEGTGGGGVRVLFAGLDDVAINNTVNMTAVNFWRNEAYLGGGVSVTSVPRNVGYVNFQNVTWIDNIARLGSAVNLDVLDIFFNRSPTQLVFEDCEFKHNTVFYTNKTGTTVGTGTIFSNSFHILFKGYTNCEGNQASCIYSVKAKIEFAENAIGTFISNQAFNGGGIALLSSAHIFLNEGSNLTFSNNIAHVHGGAIYWEGIGNQYLASSRNCFIRYKEPFRHPSEWPVILRFVDNVANVTGNDIFCTTLLGCLNSSELDTLFKLLLSNSSEMFNWNLDTWNLTNGSIATSPSHFIEDEEIICGSAHSIKAVPGNLTQLSIRMKDETNSLLPMDSLVFYTVVNDSTPFISSDKLLFTGQEGETMEYNFTTLQPRIISLRVNVTLQECPFGFKVENKTCTDANYPYIQSHVNYTASIQRGYWIGKIDGDVVVSQCYFCPFNKNLPSSDFILLPKENVTEFLCNGFNRSGKFCQNCTEGYGPVISSDRYKCVKCHSDNAKYGWSLYILWKYLPTTAILLIVMTFKLSVTSGPTNAFVLFAQMISATYGVNAGLIINYSSIEYSADFIRKIYVSLYGLWNLDFFESFDIIPICLTPDTTVLTLHTLQYLTAIYPLMFLGVFAIVLTLYERGNRVTILLLKPLHRLLARCFRFFNLKRSIMDAFATFLVLSYTKFAVISAYLLYANPLLMANGNVKKRVSYFDSTKDFDSLKYSPYLSLAVIFTLVIGLLMPTILLLYSLKPFNRFLQNHRLSFMLPGEKMKYFLNSFYHCYKDGTDGSNDRRYFASLYFYARFLLLYSYSVTTDWIEQFLVQQMVVTGMIIAISVLQPYKNYIYNLVDCMMFGLLAIINVLSMYQAYLEVAHFPLSKVWYFIQLILVFIPLCYIIGVVFYFSIYRRWIARKVCKKLATMQKKKTLKPMTVSKVLLSEFNFGEFMEEVDSQGRFQHVHYHGPMHTDTLNRDVQMAGNITPPLSSSISLSGEDWMKKLIALPDNEETK